MKCLKCRSEMSKCFQGGLTEPKTMGWICSTLGCERFGLFIEDEKENKPDVYERVTERIIKNLRQRRGFRHLLESIELEDPSLYQEIKDEIENELRIQF